MKKYILRIIAYPFVLSTILIAYIYHAINNSMRFLRYGGEWIAYAKNDTKTIQDVYLKLVENEKRNDNGSAEI